MSGPGVPSSAPSRRQKRMGPAPFASFEDLSDEVRSRLDSPEDKSGAASVVRLPGIREDATPITPSRVDPTQEFIYAGISLVGAPATPLVSAPPPSVPLTPPSTTISSQSTPQESLTSNKMSLQTPSTPRIDISRASSSSHHEDSRESTPERELFDGNNQGGAKLGLAFKEEGTLDLRSSTEELDFQEPQEKLKVHKKRSQSPAFHDDSLHQRKDSQCSEIGLLSISGRTSRLSSIGSQCSTHSRVSNVSHLSIVSGQSGRSPSPHKMLLETSFCGYKSPVNNPQAGQTGMKFEADVLEQVLLSRKHDPREVVMAEGMSVQVKSKEKPKPPAVAERGLKKPQSLVDNKVTVTIDKPTNDKVTSADKSKLPGKYVSPSGVEYTYIPLKGPIPKDINKEINSKPKLREIKSANVYSKTATQNKSAKDTINKTKPKSASSSPSVTKSSTTIMSPLECKDEPKYIRIKLKPDHLYDDDSTSTSNIQKPVRLNLRDSTQKPQTVTVSEVSNKLQTIPKVESQQKISYDTISTSSKSTPGHNIGREANVESKSPSPALSRKSSFTSLFKSRETIISPESPTIPGLRRKVSLTGMLKDAGENLRDRTRSRSKSRERDKSSTAPSSTESIDSKTKQPKSVLSIFKPKKSNSTTKIKSGSNQSTPEVLNDLDGITSVEFKFNTEANLPSPKKYYETPLHGESIRIPLHSPTHYEGRGILQDLKSSSQESQETVIDTTQRVEVTIDNDIDKKSKNETKREIDNTNRQSSTSSDNVVFSTQLGSSNDLFITKLPKEKQSKRVNDIHNEISICNTNDKIKQLNNKIKIDKSVALHEIPDDFKQSFIVEKTESLNSNTTEVLFTANFLKETAIRDVPECSSSSTKTIKKSLMGSIANEDRYSSESEKDSEHDYFKVNQGCEDKLENIEPERKGFVHQQDSFDDELPYIPTTLPLERSVAVPIVPVKQRSTYEMKTYPIERPRSTTPINLSTLEDYCEDVVGSINTENIAIAIEKLKICLPRDESTERTNKAKSPRKPGANTNWFAFGDKAPRHDDETEPPPLPPKGVQKEWINFEEIPERRKPPRRIQTIPSRSNIEIPESVMQDNVIYNYVNPEDCKCECHEIAREREQNKQQEDAVRVQEDEVPLLEDDPGDEDKSAQELVDRIKVDVTADRRSIISDSSLDLSTSIGHHENSNLDPSLRTPFTGDLGLSSNRSSIVSQDEFQSPDITTPNAFSKCS